MNDRFWGFIFCAALGGLAVWSIIDAYMGISLRWQ